MTSNVAEALDGLFFDLLQAAGKVNRLHTRVVTAGADSVVEEIGVKLIEIHDLMAEVEGYEMEATNDRMEPR